MATIMRKMNMISRCESLYRTAQKTVNLPGLYHSYVLAICHQPGNSQDFLAKHLCMNKSSVARHLSFLENEGYIHRETSPEDKRELLVFPTEKMLDIHPLVVSITKEWNTRLTEGISEEELALFHRILEKMTETSQSILRIEEERP
ncbi:MAG: MarR family transcriptional regulator [Clostridia bacterium]|nr:MarR family transcriptional regulator [Clostridia bacterium]